MIKTLWNKLFGTKVKEEPKTEKQMSLKDEKKEYISKSLKEIERVCHLAVDQGQDEANGMRHPLELVLYVLEAYAVKTAQASYNKLMEQQRKAEPVKQEATNDTPAPESKIIPFDKNKKPTVH